MGMFDYLRCEMPLPEGTPAGCGDLFQTECTPLQAMERYVLRADGRLVQGATDRGIDGAERVIEDIHCDVLFYDWRSTGEHWEFRARFTEGFCTSLALAEYEPPGRIPAPAAREPRIRPRTEAERAEARTAAALVEAFAGLAQGGPMADALLGPAAGPACEGASTATDAAAACAKAALRGCSWSVHERAAGEGVEGFASATVSHEGACSIAEAGTPALAICLALAKALDDAVRRRLARAGAPV